MTCPEMETLLHGMLDGELDAVNAVRFEKHVATCTACAAEYARQKELAAALRRPALRYRAPEHLRARIAAATVGTAVRPPQAATGWRRAMADRLTRWRWGAGGFILALAASLLLFVVTPEGNDSLQQELIAGHVRSLLATHLTDVTTSDQHTVKPWFNSKLDAAPPVVDLAGQGFPLVGGRLDYIDNRVVAALVYKRREHVINLFVWPAPDEKDSEPQTASQRGYNLLHWVRSGLAFWAVSDLNPTELRTFESLFAGQS
jgi:anti-sigma factor RsiW